MRPLFTNHKLIHTYALKCMHEACHAQNNRRKKHLNTFNCAEQIANCKSHRFILIREKIRKAFDTTLKKFVTWKFMRQQIAKLSER